MAANKQVDAAGTGGANKSGTASGGSGNGFGPGGNSYTGSTGTSRGGDVQNFGGSVTNAPVGAGAAAVGASKHHFPLFTLRDNIADDRLQTGVVEVEPTPLALQREETLSILHEYVLFRRIIGACTFIIPTFTMQSILYPL